jgi:hypothetical protein
MAAIWNGSQTLLCSRCKNDTSKLTFGIVLQLRSLGGNMAAIWNGNHQLQRLGVNMASASKCHWKATLSSGGIAVIWKVDGCHLDFHPNVNFKTLPEKIIATFTWDIENVE